MSRATTLCLYFLAMLTQAAWLPAPACSQDRAQAVGYEDFSELAAKVRQLEAENAQIRSRLESGITAGYDGQGGAYGCGGDYCGASDPCCDACCEPACCPCGSWYAGAELIYMQPRWNDWDALIFLEAGARFSFVPYDYDYDETARFYVGYTGCNGLGVRASWWQFDHNSQVVGASQTGPISNVDGNLLGIGPNERLESEQSLEVETIDFEITHCCDACGGHLVVGIGLRYAQFAVTTRERRIAFLGQVLQDAVKEQSFEGVGPTLALELIRPLYFPGWALYSNVRASVVFGEEQMDEAFDGNTLFSREDDEGLAIGELQLGLQWTHGCYTVRGGWQAQYWSNAGRGGTTDADSPGQAHLHDLFFQGFSLSLAAQF